jgi:hypothetical protein
MSEYLLLCLSLAVSYLQDARTIRNIEEGAGPELTDAYLLFLDQVRLFILMACSWAYSFLDSLLLS